MRVVTGIVLFVLLLGHSFAQNYPTKPPKIVVGYPPGGSGDFTTRIIADELSKELGVTFVVENKPGAGGSIASEYVAKSAPDGYTILNQGNHAYNRVMYKDLSYSDKDFIPVSRVANGATLLVVGQNSQFQSLKELIAFAKANPGKLFNASAGFGSAPHVAACAFEAAAGIKITSVQFKGGGPAAQSLLAGDTQMMFATSPTVTGFIQAGRMRPFLVSIAKGSPSIPNVPGGDAAGVPGFQSTFWFGLYVPAGTPQPIVRRLHAAAAKALSKPEVQQKIAAQGMDALPSASPEAFADEIRAEAPEIERALKGCGAKIE
ncbi:MAG TPA: tripartite tricarboxylate transporter substrate binding protein [Burkholderiales bacterium]|nr:tripartite tricarboxylate transporter substrate binding protein [Burkholderiales bacterium]